ncbi:MAG: insulinase family protein, partial [Nitrospinota bacterium]|nr:insulinase family protein [Nitrospinota bacterium]
GVDNGNDGFWYINGTFAPELLEKGKESTLRELKKWQNSGVTEQELNAKKETITGSYKVRLATTRGLAGTILGNAEAGRDVNFLDDYPEIIKAIQLESVNKAIMIYCNPERLVTISAGTISE